jgi:hypothetical protein
MCNALHVKYRYSCQILMKLEFSRKIFVKYQILNSKKTRPVERELFHAERHRDMTKLIAPFRNFGKRTKLIYTVIYMIYSSVIKQCCLIFEDTLILLIIYLFIYICDVAVALKYGGSASDIKHY